MSTNNNPWPFPSPNETQEEFKKRCPSPAERRAAMTPEQLAAEKLYEAIKDRAYDLVRNNIGWDDGDVKLSFIKQSAEGSFTAEEIESDAFYAGVASGYEDVCGDWPGGEYGDAPELILD